MMDCSTGPCESMHVNKWVQCAYVPSLFIQSVFFWVLLHPFLFTSSVLDMRVEMYAGA